jgi:hypothetical protein
MPAARVLSLVAALAALTRGAAAYERVIESGALVHPSRWRAEVTAPALLPDRATAEEGFVALAPGAGGGLRVRRAASAPAEGARAAILVLDANERAARALEVELLATDDPRDVHQGAEEEARSPSATRVAVACAASFSPRAGGWRLESASVVPNDPIGVTPTCTVRGAETDAAEARGDAAAAAAAAAGTDETHSSGENQTLFSFASARLEVALPVSTPFVREVTVRAAYPPRDAPASGSGSDALLGGGSGSGSSPATLAEEEFFHVPNAPSSQTPPPKVRVARLALASRADATALALAWIQRRATCAATLDADASSACGELFAAELFHDGGDEADAAAFASANRLGGEVFATVPPSSPSDKKVASPPFAVAADACCAAVAARDAGECSCAADVVPAFAETVTGGGSDSSVARADRDAGLAVDFARRVLACGSDANNENNKRVASCADDSALLAVVRASVVEGGAAPAAASAQSARAAPPPPPPPAAPEVDAYDAFLAWLGEREREGEGASPGKEGVEAPSPTSSRAPSPPAARGGRGRADSDSDFERSECFECFECFDFGGLRRDFGRFRRVRASSAASGVCRERRLRGVRGALRQRRHRVRRELSRGEGLGESRGGGGARRRGDRVGRGRGGGDDSGA